MNNKIHDGSIALPCKLRDVFNEGFYTDHQFEVIDAGNQTVCIIWRCGKAGMIMGEKIVAALNKGE